MKDRILIVGSGASGVHFALSVLRKGYEVVMLDVGGSIEEERGEVWRRSTHLGHKHIGQQQVETLSREHRVGVRPVARDLDRVARRFREAALEGTEVRCQCRGRGWPVLPPCATPRLGVDDDEG